MFRQGDVLLVRAAGLPAGCRKQHESKNLVLREGEVTGHAHRLLTRDLPSITFLAPDGSVYLLVQEDAQIVHEEHAQLAVLAGLYILPQQVEVSPWRARRVAD